MKRFALLLSLLALLVTPATAQTASPFYWSGTTARMFPSTGVLLDGNRSVRFGETTANGANYVEVIAPTSLASDFVLTLPAATGTIATTTSAMTIGNAVTGGTSGSLLFVGAGPVLAQDNSHLSWADATDTLSLTTATSGANSLIIQGSDTTAVQVQAAPAADSPTMYVAATSVGDVLKLTKSNASGKYLILANPVGDEIGINIAGSGVTDYTFTLPLDDGAANQFLQTNGAGVTTWASPTDVMTTRGDLSYRNASNVTDRLPIGAANRVLFSDGTDVSWAQVPADTGISGVLGAANGGTGVANNALQTLTRSGNHAITLTTTNTTSLTLPLSGTLATLAGSEAFTNKTLNGNTATNLISGSGTLTLNTSGTATVPNVTATLATNPGTTTGDIAYCSTTATPCVMSRLAGAAGVVHSAVTTAPTISLVVNADVDAAAAIAGSKLVAAASSVAGAVSTGSQTMTGAKTFETQLIGKGTATNDSAGAGYIGEYVEQVLLRANKRTTVAGQYIALEDVTGMPLTAGDWDISGTCCFQANATITSIECLVSTATGNNTTGGVIGNNYVAVQVGAATASDNCLTISDWRVSLSGSQTYYLKGASIGLASTIWGRMSARRAR
jgi:hypothetical protein